MPEELPIPYGDFIYISPVERKQILGNTLSTVGKVIAVGDEAVNTHIGDMVAFELWDKPEFVLPNDKVYHFVREKDLIAKIPLSLL